MENISLINELLDGTLKIEQEEKLYSSLLRSEELRQEMRHFISIKNAVRSDFSAFNPSPAATMNIFGKLGFSAVPIISETPVISPNKSIWQTISAAKSAILINLFSALVGGLIVFLLFNLFNSNNLNITVKENFSNNINNNLNPNTPLNVNNSFTDNPNNDSKSNDIKTKIITKYVYIEKPSNNIEKTDIITKDNINYSKIEIPINNSEGIFNKNKQNLNENYKNSSGPINISKFDNSSQFDISQIIKNLDEYNISLEFCGNQFFKTMNENIEPSDFQLFNNYNLNLLYKFNNSFKAGLSLKRENFYQTFTGTDSIGNKYLYEQKPNFTTIGLFGRYNYLNFEKFSPFVQLEIGLNQGGITGRGTLGAEVNVINGISFILGLDYSEFYYTHQNKLYNSNKIGFNYGISFKY